MRLGKVGIDRDGPVERLDPFVQPAGQGVCATQLGQGPLVAWIEPQAELELAAGLLEIPQPEMRRAQMQVNLGIAWILAGDDLELRQRSLIVLPVEGGDSLDAMIAHALLDMRAQQRLLLRGPPPYRLVLPPETGREDHEMTQ